jgi:hypothetical protein
MKTQRIHVVTALNAGKVQREGDLIVVRDACGAVDDIVMHRVLYPGAELRKGAPTLNGRVAPIGHPKNEAGQYISANSADALLTSYAGVVCKNARHEAGRTLTDLYINAAMAKSHPKGAEVVAWCEAALNGESPEPMHVSTGLIAEMVDRKGESRGKAYDRVATNIRYDHLALLPGAQGAASPEEGVGMFNDGDGNVQPVVTLQLPEVAEDRRFEGVTGWLRKLLGNGADELSFSQIERGLQSSLPEMSWVREVFARYAIWVDKDGRMHRQDYTVASDGSVAWAGSPQEVREERSYEPIANHSEEDPMKDIIIMALNAAGIDVSKLTTDAALLSAYNQHVAASAKAPIEAQLTAVNAQLATLQAAAQQAEQAELEVLANELAAPGGVLTAADFKAMGIARCRELKAAGSAAPIVPALNSRGAAHNDGFAGAKVYDLNADLSQA